MATLSYAESFLPAIQKKYAAQSKSDFLTTAGTKIKFVDAHTIKVPQLTLGGYGTHTRSQGFNSSDYASTYLPYTLSFDRDVEFFIDPQDVDETNTAVSIANIQNEFEEQVAIPERDKYRFSKLYKDYIAQSKTADSTTLTAANILSKFDAAMEAMDEAEVNTEGRVLVVTPAVNTLLKNAEGIQRTLEVKDTTGKVNRLVHSLDDVQIVVVPSSRLKTAYEDSGTGENKAYTATSSALQINMMLIEPSCQISVDKYAYIKVFTPGTDSRTGDGYIYQNRKYIDTFLIKAKNDGLWINAN